MKFFAINVVLALATLAQANIIAPLGGVAEAGQVVGVAGTIIQTASGATGVVEGASDAVGTVGAILPIDSSGCGCEIGASDILAKLSELVLSLVPSISAAVLKGALGSIEIVLSLGSAVLCIALFLINVLFSLFTKAATLGISAILCNVVPLANLLALIAKACLTFKLLPC
ncbi:hypothetical protein ACFFRR_007115 [Megaselia abdita]